MLAALLGSAFRHSMMNRASRWATLAAFGLGLCASGCAIEPDQRHYADGVVMVAPPPPEVETIGVPPQPGYVWIGGYWNWVGTRHEWVAGHWSAPRPGRHWVAYEWVRQGDGWKLHPGHWERG
jgi:hypothetical protein